MSPSKNTLIINPKTDTYIFGVVPEIKHRSHYFHEGNIYLRFGKHFGPNRGFGIEHIWVQHEHELIQAGYSIEKYKTPINAVANYVSDIIYTGSGLYCEFASIRGDHRITVVRSSKGLAIIEPFSNSRNESHYRIITAYRSKKAQGTKIGTLG